jgi:hypothetical protein
VQTICLDSYVTLKQLGPPSLIKIDAEGAEINILQGASALLCGPSTFICEMHPYAWVEYGRTFDDLQSLARQAGRTIRYLDEDHEVTQPHYGIAVLEH